MEPNKKKPSKKFFEFLPSVLEITEKPASPTGRLVIWLIFAFAVWGLLWSYYGEVDVVAVAPGKIVPKGNVKVVQAPVSGVITSIYSEEGDYVEKGSALLQIDTTINEADYRMFDERLKKAEFEKKLIHAMLDNDEAGFSGLAKNGYSEISSFRAAQKAGYVMNLRLLRVSYQQTVSEKDTLLRVIEQVEGTARYIDAQIMDMADLTAETTLEEQNLEVLKIKVARLKKIMENSKTLFENGLLPLMDYEEAKTNLELAVSEYTAQETAIRLRKFENQRTLNELLYQKANLESDLAVREASAAEIDEKLERAEAETDNFIVEYRKNLQNDLVQLDMNISQYKNEVAKGGAIIGYNTIYAPVSGEIHGFTINTVGAVAQASQVLLSIVPDDTELIAEAYLLNKDIGFVSEGQEAVIKVEAYPFQKFKTIEGQVVYVSPNSYADEKLGNVYKLKIQLNADYLEDEGVEYYISPGMQVSAEVKTGKRRILDFFLEPIMKYLSESLQLR